MKDIISQRKSKHKNSQMGLSVFRKVYAVCYDCSIKYMDGQEEGLQ